MTWLRSSCANCDGLGCEDGAGRECYAREWEQSDDRLDLNVPTAEDHAAWRNDPYNNPEV